MDGGAGIRDSAAYESAPGPVNVDLGTGIATGDGRDTLSGIEYIEGSPHGDKLFGGDLADGLWGNAGADEINGRGGNDTVFGNDGNDELYAGSGSANALLGGRGSDFCQLAPGSGFVDCERGPVSRATQAAAAPMSFASTFTAPNQVKSKTITISPAASSVQILASWANPAASLGTTVELVDSSGKVAARGLATSGNARLSKPAHLRLKTTRGTNYLAVEVQTPAKLRVGKKPLKLRIKLRAKTISGPTAVSTTVAQRRKR